jgi:hypothetical protein
MEMDLWVFLEPALALFMGVKIVEDHVKVAIRKDSGDVFNEPRNSTRPRRFECMATMRPVATSSAANPTFLWKLNERGC